MNERSNIITFQGNPLTLIGNEIKVGDKAPNFNVVANDLSPVTLGDYTGKTLIISAVPSLDTEVCDRETRTFNEEAINLGDGVKVLTISMDLPFAQARWCGAAGIDRVQTLSDYQTASFGENYGVLIKELHLLSRVVFIIDRDSVIRYVQTVGEITDEPNYAEILGAVRSL
jgi:thioredoxin-dependent peroxiredoxin